MNTAPSILEFDRICRGFFGVPVLRDISLSLPHGRALGLIGENGAGKSTLMNILGGVLPADSGQMLLDGRPYAPRSSREASRHGVAFIHQELNLFANLTIAENLHLPDFPRMRILPFIDRRSMRRRARELLAAVDLQVSPDTPVEDLSPGERQLVEIAKAIGADARLIILDEPTTSLTSHEADRLFVLMERLRAKGASMIYISHRLAEVLRVCDDIAVLRDGQLVATGPREQFTTDTMISLMVGRSIEQLYPPRASSPSDEPVLQVHHITRSGVVHDISFTLNAGEILGISGLMGAGRTELARILFGLDPHDSGSILIHGQPLTPTPRRSIRRGLAFLTENRREEGLLMDATIAQNMALVSLPHFAHTPLKLIHRRRLRDQVEQMSTKVQLTASSIARQPARTLSGGNQQKVVLGKWLLNRPNIFILDEPTRGIDVGAKHEVYKIINTLADQGAAILLISSEIEELIGMCDHILVMSRGQIRDDIPRSDFHRERILRAAFATEVPA